MFVVWGTRTVSRRIGWVADVCPLCRRWRACQLSRVGNASHVYYVAVGAGELVGYQRRCPTCQTEVDTDPGCYGAISRRRRPIDALIEETAPQLDDERRQILDADALVQRGALSPEQRFTTIAEAVRRLNPLLVERGAQMQFDGLSGLGCLGAFVLPTLALVLGASELVALGAGALILLATAVSVGTEVRRYTRRVVVPRLARALAPLAPTREELDDVLAATSAMPIARHVGVDDLEAALRAAQAAAEVAVDEPEDPAALTALAHEVASRPAVVCERAIREAIVAVERDRTPPDVSVPVVFCVLLIFAVPVAIAILIPRAGPWGAMRARLGLTIDLALAGAIVWLMRADRRFWRRQAPELARQIASLAPSDAALRTVLRRMHRLERSALARFVGVRRLQRAIATATTG